jgi:hypothetical protein
MSMSRVIWVKDKFGEGWRICFRVKVYHAYTIISLTLNNDHIYRKEITFMGCSAPVVAYFKELSITKPR